MKPKTIRIYTAIQRDFMAWCKSSGVKEWPSVDDVAKYLQDRKGSVSLSALPVHVSAISKLFRERGYSFDTKDPAIQEILIPARAARKQS